MSFKTVRRIASQLLGKGENRIRIIPEESHRAEEALTRDDVRALIKQGVVYAEPRRGVSRARAIEKQKKKKRGHRRGLGSRKGRKYSKVPRKRIWMNKIRAQRACLRGLIDDKKLKSDAYRETYLMIKGGAFKSKAGLLSYLREKEYVKGEEKPKKKPKERKG